LKAFFIKYIPAHLGRIFNLRGFVFFIVFTAELFGGSSVSGIIREENNKPVPDVNIKLYPTSFGAVSDEQGRFNFSRIPEGKYKLIFDHIGYRTKEIEINSKVADNIDLSVILEPSVIDLKRKDFPSRDRIY